MDNEIDYLAGICEAGVVTGATGAGVGSDLTAVGGAVPEPGI